MKGLFKNCITVMLIAITLFSSCSTSQKLVRESNPNRVFRVDNIPIHVRCVAQYIDPMGMPQRPLVGDENFIEVLNDKVYMDLPYFGRIYFPIYTTDGSSFAEPYRDLKVVRNKKNDGTIMNFNVSHDNIHFAVEMELWDGGATHFSITPSNGQTCSFSGYWDESQLYDKYGNPVDTKYY